MDFADRRIAAYWLSSLLLYEGQSKDCEILEGRSKNQDAKIQRKKTKKY